MCAEKACPVVLRVVDGILQILAFKHPLAGRQFVKGTIETGETPHTAAIRELREESGLELVETGRFLGQRIIGGSGQNWHFFQFDWQNGPDNWRYKTDDDGGRVFDFFWQPLSWPLDKNWHPDFHEARAFILSTL